MTLGRPIQPLQLTQEERETLERWVRRPGSVLAGAGHPELRGRENEHEGGAAALWRGVWMGCWMSRGRVLRDRLWRKTNREHTILFGTGE